MNKSTLGFLRSGIGVAALALISATSVGAKEIVARMSYHWAPAHHSAIYCEKFAERVNERGKGIIRIDTFPSAQLFGIRENMGALTSGAIELGGIVGTVSFPPINKNYNIEGMPGAFEDFAELRAFFQEDEKGQEVWADIMNKTRSQLVAYNPVGPFLTFTSVRPLNSMDSYDGLKARYIAGHERPRLEALGASVVSLPTGEVYTALQNGMIDTLSTVPSAIKAYSWWEYLKFGQKPYQFFLDAYIVANQEWWNGLPDDARQIMIEVGKEISEESTASIMQFSDDVLEEFIANEGGRIDEFSAEESAKLEKLNTDVILPALATYVDPDVLTAMKEFTAD